jgi:hypothetical protein
MFHDFNLQYVCFVGPVSQGQTESTEKWNGIKNTLNWILKEKDAKA